MALIFVDSSTSTSNTIVIPATSQIGDFAFLADWAQNISGNPTQVVPTDWTEADPPVTSSTCRSILSWKQLVDVDSGSTITGMNGTNFNNKILLVFRSLNGAFTSITSGSVWGSQITNANPTLQTVLASAQTPPLIVLGMGSTSANVAVNFTTASPVFDGSVANPTRQIVGFKMYDSGPQNHSIDIPDNGSNNCLRTGYFLLTEPALEQTLMGMMVL